MRDAIEKAIQLLKEEGRPFIPEEVQRLVQERKLEVGNKDMDVIAQAVLEEGHRRTLEVLGGLQEALGVPLLSRVGKILPKGNRVSVVYKNTPLNTEVVARVQGQDEKLYFPPPNEPLLGEFELHLSPGAVTLVLVNPSSTSWLFVNRGKVFSKSHNCGEDKARCVRGTLQDVKTLRPLWASIGFSDLEGAVEALSRLGEGESRVEGTYVLARNERAWMLRRGFVLGEPRLDGDLLLEREVNLSFPGDVEMSFSVKWGYPFMDLRFLYIRWGTEEVLIDTNRSFFSAEVLERDPVTLAIRSGLGMEIEHLDRDPDQDGWSGRTAKPSPKMLAFLRALNEHDEPFRALAEGKFLTHVKAELFLGL